MQYLYREEATLEKACNIIKMLDGFLTGKEVNGVSWVTGIKKSAALLTRNKLP
jgi:hypothetical protein